MFGISVPQTIAHSPCLYLNPLNRLKFIVLSVIFQPGNTVGSKFYIVQATVKKGVKITTDLTGRGVLQRLGQDYYPLC